MMVINRGTVVVVRDGKRVRVVPSGAPFDFTPEEVASAEAAGIVMAPVPAATKPRVIVSEPKEAPATVKPKKGKAKVEIDAEDDIL